MDVSKREPTRHLAGAAIPSTIPALTPAQRAVYELVCVGAEAGRPPSLRELTEQLGGRSTQAVQGHLAALERKGLVEWEPGKFRTLRPKRKVVRAVLPMLGEVS